MKKLQNHEHEQSVYPIFDPEDALYVCDFGYHKTPPNHVYGPAVRPYFLIHMIESGKGWIERNGEKTFLHKGQAFIIRPNELTTYSSDKDEPWTYCWIGFSGSFAEKIMERTTSELFVPFRQSGLSALKTAIEDENDAPIYVLNLLFTVLSSVQTTSNTAEEPPMQTAIRFLENNYFRNVKVQKLAASLGYSRAYFTTAFTEATGKSPYRYLSDIRMKKAKELLRQSRFSVEEISYSIGFSSIVRFSESFKKYTGLSPLQYRKTTFV